MQQPLPAKVTVGLNIRLRSAYFIRTQIEPRCMIEHSHHSRRVSHSRTIVVARRTAADQSKPHLDRPAESREAARLQLNEEMYHFLKVNANAATKLRGICSLQTPCKHTRAPHPSTRPTVISKAMLCTWARPPVIVCIVWDCCSISLSCGAPFR